MSDPAEIIAAVRALHQPAWHRQYTGRYPEETWLVCHGCDEGPYAEAAPGWPCRTADLVYTAEEIAAREPRVPECPEDHRTIGEGPPVRARAVFMLLADGTIEQRRWQCDHVAGIPLTPGMRKSPGH